MSKQKTLFPADDIKKKTKFITVKEKVKKFKEEEDEKKLSGKSRKPRQEIYTCICGLKMHWKVAEGRSDGCPQCRRKIPLSEIFEDE